MYFGICGEKEVDKINLKGKKSILVRIGGNLDLKTSYLYQDILDLDIEDIHFEYVTKDFQEKLLVSFLRLNDFLLKNDFDEVIVHCALGISRSPAIMICIAKILGSFQMENYVKDNFKFYNQAIVNEFSNFKFVKKDLEIDEFVFNRRVCKRMSQEEIDKFFCDGNLDNKEDKSDGLVKRLSKKNNY